MAATLAGVAAAGCGAPPPPPPTPLDAEQAYLRAEGASQLDRPARILFDWAASERGARFTGRGVARLEPRYKARLDLFLPDGTTIAKASLVGGELRVPPGAAAGLIPPPRMLWGAVGVVRPGREAALVGGERLDDGRTRIRFLHEPSRDEIHYTLRGSRLEEVDLLRGEDVIETVRLEWDDGARYPSRAVYRNLPDFRELRITRDDVAEVEPFPPDIWDPGRSEAP